MVLCTQGVHDPRLQGANDFADGESSAPTSMEPAAAAPSEARVARVETGDVRFSTDLELPESIQQLLAEMREFVRTQRQKRLSQSRALGSTEPASSAPNEANVTNTNPVI